MIAEKFDAKDTIKVRGKVLNPTAKGTIAQLRASAGLYDNYISTETGKEGTWIYDATDNTSADNGATVIVTADSKRLKRPLDKGISATWFGASTTDNSNQAFINALNYSKTSLIPLNLPTGNYPVSSGLFNDLQSSVRGRGLTMQGNGRDISRVLSRLTSNDSAVIALNHAQFTMKMVQMYNDSVRKGTGVLAGDTITNREGDHMIFDDMTFVNLHKGLDLERTWQVSARNLMFASCDTCLIVATNGAQFDRLDIDGGGLGVLVDSHQSDIGYGITFTTPVIQATQIGLKAKRVKGALVNINPYYEGNSVAHEQIGVDTNDDIEAYVRLGGAIGEDNDMIVDRVRNFYSRGLSNKTNNIQQVKGNTLISDIDLPNVSFDRTESASLMALGMDSAYNSSSAPIFYSDFSNTKDSVSFVPTTSGISITQNGGISIIATNGTLQRDTVNVVHGRFSVKMVPTQGVTMTTDPYTQASSVSVRIKPSVFKSRYGGVKMKVFIRAAGNILVESSATMSNTFGSTVHSIWKSARKLNSLSSAYKGKWMWIYMPVDTVAARALAAGSIGGTDATRTLDYLEFRVVTSYSVAGAVYPSDSTYTVNLNEIEFYNSKFPSGNFSESKYAEFNPERINVGEYIMRDSTASGASGTYTSVVRENTTGLLKLVAGAASEVPLTFSTGLTRSTNTITNNLSTGVSGGQTIIGGTASGNNLTLRSNTSNNGKINFGNAGTSYYDESGNTLNGLTNAAINTVYPNTGVLTLLHRQNIAQGIKISPNGTTNQTSGPRTTLSIAENFSPTSGTATLSAIDFNSFIVNQTGGANGITGLIYNNATITAAADWRTFYDPANTGYSIYQNGTAKNYLNGITGIGVVSPTAKLHLAAGTAAANTAPLKFTAGTLLTTPEAGVMNYDGTNFYLSPSTTLKRLPLTNNATPSNGQIPIGNGTDYTVANIAQGTGITVTNGSGTISISSSVNLQQVTNVDSATTNTIIAKHLSGNTLTSATNYSATGTNANSFTGTDVAGMFTHTTTGITPGDVKINDVTFGTPYTRIPTVIVTCANSNTATARPYVLNVTTTGFSVYLQNAAANTSYAYNYIVIQ